MKESLLVLIISLGAFGATLSIEQTSQPELCVLQDLVHFTEYRFEQMSELGIAKFISPYFKIDFCFQLTMEDVKNTCAKLHRPEKDLLKDSILLVSWNLEQENCVTLTKDDLKTSRREADKVKFFFQTQNYTADSEANQEDLK